ncbi:hypothetical protein BTH55_02990 [Lactobacillus delbrueckii subsp. bulgaricus]|nr:hypothetical protein [Lactobacillus delbrueckii subsp. bulgaricus]MBT8856863.1 hypothetical protein [Lactobacillus delbrueckii subsp. bulgaricus]
MKKRHWIYLSARKMDTGQVPEGFTVYNDFGHAKTVICGQLMSKAYGLLSYDQRLSKAVMDDNALTDISNFPEPILKGLGAFL